jgi:hypothetical protein
MSVPAGTDCLLTLQPGHYAKVPFSPTRGSHAQALSIRPQLDFFGDLKSSKTAASKSLKEKRQAKKAKAAGSGSSPTGPRSPSGPRSPRTDERLSTAQAFFDARTMRADPLLGAIRV